MDTFDELVAAVQDDFTVGDESTLVNPTSIKRAINRSYVMIAGMHLWPKTEDGKKTSSFASQEYYDYPSTWLPFSLWKLKVDGVDYGDPMVFKDYLYEKENGFPSGLTTLYGTEANRVFIYPTPTTNGNKNIELWGQKAVDLLVNGTDVTIFSYSMRDVNEAIILESTARLKMKTGEIGETIIPRVGEMHDLEAKEIIARAWAKIVGMKSKGEKTTPMFAVPDFFAPRGVRLKTRIGDF